MADTLQTLNGELITLCRDVGTKGQLGGQAHLFNAKGGWRDLVNHVNTMASNLTSQVREVSTIAKAVAEGDLSQKMTMHVSGEVHELKLTLNNMVDQLTVFSTEVHRVAEEVGTQGLLGGQAAVPNAWGKWKSLTRAVNTMASNLTVQVRDIIGVATAVADGDLSQKITVDVQGEVLAFKTTVNGMVDNLRSFSDQVTSVAKAIGEEGKLGRYAHVPHVKGCWQAITDHINRASHNLTEQVRSITYFSQQLADGMLDAHLDFDSPGEINQMVTSLLKMKAQLQLTADHALRITQGDYATDITPRSCYDAFGTLLNTMTDTLKNKTENLSRSDALLSEFLMHSQDIFIRVDSDYRILYLSDSFEKITQQQARQWIGLLVEELSEQLTAEFIEKKIKLSAGAGVGTDDLFAHTIKINAATGVRYFDAAVWSITDQQAAVKEYHIMARDITDKQHLFERNAMLDLMQDHSPILHGVLDVKTRRLIQANQALRQRIGLDITKQLVFAHDVHSPEELEYIENNILPVLMEEKCWSGEMRVTFPHTDAPPITVFRQSRLITTDDDRQYIACAMLDITEQLERQQELTRQKNEIKRFQELQDQSPAMYFIADFETQQITYSSQKGLMLLKREADAYDEPIYIKDYHTDEELKIVNSTIIPTLQREGIWHGIHCMTPGADGSKKITTRDTVFLYEDTISHKKQMFATFFDVSKEMQWEKEKTLNQQQLDRVLKLALASEVSAGIAYQINQPLSVVSSTLQLWASEKNKADSWRQEIINTLPNLIQMTHDMGETIHQVKNLLTADSVMESTSLCLKAACRALIQEEKNTNSGDNITLVLVTDNSLADNDAAYHIYFDRTLLELALRNLFNNAKEAMKGYDTKKSSSIYCFLSLDSQGVSLRVCDNGPGVLDALKDRIFEPFYTTKQDGTGTGLSLMHRLQEHYSVFIALVSTFQHPEIPSVGACFQLLFKTQ